MGIIRPHKFIPLDHQVSSSTSQNHLSNLINLNLFIQVYLSYFKVLKLLFYLKITATKNIQDKLEKHEFFKWSKTYLQGCFFLLGRLLKRFKIVLVPGYKHREHRRGREPSDYAEDDCTDTSCLSISSKLRSLIVRLKILYLSFLTKSR